jgi:hypothetical protein
MLDVAVHADRAAVHDAPYTSGGGGFNETADRGRVHRPIGLGPEAGLSVDRSDVVDDVSIARRPAQRVRVGEIARDELDPGSRQVPGRVGVPDQRADCVAAARQRTREVSTRETGRAGD